MNREGLLKKLQEFDRKRNSLLDGLESLDQETLTARPLEGKWSILEIVEHMAIAEREVLMGLPDPSELRVYKRNFKNKLMLKIVMFVLGRRIKVKVPSRTMIPEGQTELSMIAEIWDENQAWFRNYVEGCGPDDLKKAVFKHPVSGPIDVYQAIEMSFAHFESHRAQIEKLLQLQEHEG